MQVRKKFGGDFCRNRVSEFVSEFLIHRIAHATKNGNGLVNNCNTVVYNGNGVVNNCNDVKNNDNVVVKKWECK